MSTELEESKKEEQERWHQRGATALFLVGWGLPLAGYVWGPGEWWEYLIWLILGTVAICLFEWYTGVRDEFRDE